MQCVKCGTMLHPGAGFCGSCGSQQPQAAHGQGAQPAPQGGYPPTQQQGYPPPQHQGGYPPPQPQGGYPPQQQGGHGHAPQYGQPPQAGYGQPGYPPPQHGQQPGYPPPQHGQQPGYPPPQQGQQPGYPPPQQGYPPQPEQGQQPGYPPHGHGPQPGYPPSGQPGQGYPQHGPGPGAAPLQPYAILMQQRLTRLTGQMFVAPTRLYFVCASNKGGLAVALGKGIGGAIGGLVAAAGLKGPGDAIVAYDEQTLHQLTQQHEGSLVMEAQQIKAIKDTFWTHAIWFNGKTYALPNGLPKDIKPVLTQWCHANNVKHTIK